MALEVEDADIDHHDGGDEQLQGDERRAQLAATGCEAGAAFQRQGRLERGDVEGRIETCGDAYGHAQHRRPRQQLRVIVQRDVTHRQFADQRPFSKEICQQQTCHARPDRHDYRLTDEAGADAGDGAAQHAARVHAFHTHGSFGQLEVEKVDGRHDDEQHASPDEHTVHEAVALVVVLVNACEVGLGQRHQAEHHQRLGLVPVLGTAVVEEVLLHVTEIGIGKGLAHGGSVGVGRQTDVAREVVVVQLVEVLVAEAAVDGVWHTAVVGEVLEDAAHAHAVVA